MVAHVLMTAVRSDIFRKLCFPCVKMDDVLTDLSWIVGMSDKQIWAIHSIKCIPSLMKNGFGRMENF